MNDTYRKLRLNHLINTDFDGSQVAFATKAQRSPARVAQMCGAKEPFGERAATQLAEDLGLPKDWFVANWPTPKEAKRLGIESNQPYPFNYSPVPLEAREPDTFPEGSPVLALHAEDYLPDGVVLIKESTVTFAGGDGRVVPQYQEIEKSQPATYRRAWFVSEGMNPAHVKRFGISGSSMEPLLFDGDTALVHLKETDIRDGKVYALRYGDELRVKRVYKKLDGGLILHSENPEFRPRDEELSPALVDEYITIIGRVREKAGKGGL